MSDRDGVLRVVQLNIGSLLEPDWEHRRHEIVAWMDELDPDIACFEEVWESPQSPNTAGWIAAELQRPMHWAFGGHSFGSSVWPDDTLQFGSAVLSRHAIDHHEAHRLPVADTADMTVEVPWELFHASTAGLDVYCTHLAAAPFEGNHRALQVVAIDDIIRHDRADADRTEGFGTRRIPMPPILAGDFNAEPDSDEMRFLAGLTAIDGRTTFYQDSWKVAGEGVGYTQDWRDNPIAADLNVHRKRIDYVWVGDPFRREDSAGRVLNAELAFHTSKTGVLASDHRGLVVDIVWPTKPEAATGEESVDR